MNLKEQSVHMLQIMREISIPSSNFKWFFDPVYKNPFKELQTKWIHRKLWQVRISFTPEQTACQLRVLSPLTLKIQELIVTSIIQVQRWEKLKVCAPWHCNLKQNKT